MSCGINKLRLILLMWTLTANKNISYLIIFFSILIIGCNEKSTETNLMMDGYNMLLIGNSFFIPYAQNLEKVAIDAGFDSLYWIFLVMNRGSWTC